MAWISQNWIWVLFAVVMIAMHTFDHGGHDSGHKAHQPSNKDGEQRESESDPGHQH